MEPEYSRKMKTGGEPAEVTGVSRSGRVRKKSSKLADFESPDEIDTRFKRKTDRPQKPIKIVKDIGPFDESDPEVEDDLVMDIKDEALEVEDWSVGEEGDEDMGEEGDMDGEDANDPLQVDEDSNDTQHRETSNYSQAKSVYLSEKQGKKSVVIKDGQVVQRKKAQRKDKGKSRFTAYMLWAREVRPGIIESNPSMDFSAVNKRLGELWALVPTSQKYNWKRRAKRLAAKGNQKGMISTGKAAKQSNASTKSNLINKGGVKPQQLVRASKTEEQPAVTPPVVQKVLVQTPRPLMLATDNMCESSQEMIEIPYTETIPCSSAVQDVSDSANSKFLSYSVEKVEARKGNGEWRPSTLSQSDISLLDKIFLHPTKGQGMSSHSNLSSSLSRSPAWEPCSTWKPTASFEQICRSHILDPELVQEVSASQEGYTISGNFNSWRSNTSSSGTSRSAVAVVSDHSPTGSYKVTGCSPIDVAAHLKLLGESLNNIGQKLKEHEGQIAVSGSLSVLLDSMLCVLGPLACLTTQIDEIRDAIPQQTLSKILDNIAYIMPGIV